MSNVRTRIRGWLLDLYPSAEGEMAVWVIGENGERVKLVDRYRPKIYIACREVDLKTLQLHLDTSRSVADYRIAEKYVSIMDPERSKVLEVDITDSRRTPFFARKILKLGGYQKYQLYNVDIPDAQSYLYDRDIFPLASLEIETRDKGLTYHLKDSVESENYKIPPLRMMWIEVQVASSGRIPSYSDPIHRITLKTRGKEFVIKGETEKEKILNLVEAVQQEDPDIIFTHWGDSYLFPYLARRAMVCGVLDRLVLGREQVALKAKRRRGVTFFSYGRVYFKAPVRRLYGRIHIDVDNSFIYADCGLEGLIELARTCRVPLHRAARATIGTIMTSLQLYQAVKDDILIPWKKSEPESFKSAWELLIADRGGFIFEPKVGIHDWVGELDFASMYPTLMATRNISPETVLCECCPDSPSRVPELDYNICQKRIGIVPKVLRLILKKRADYKRMRNESKDPKLREKFERRQSALKWILVTSFGYLGYRNARFGRVDAHIAVCALARDALLKTAHLAEERGFEIVHGIVDSIWLKKEDATLKEYIELCREIENQLGLPISFEGRYRWIVFLPSRMHPAVPVLNRYYGVYEDGKIKARGIEVRRRDTPEFIREAQADMIRTLAKAKNSKRFVETIPGAIKVLRGSVEKLLKREVPLEDLIIEKQLSQAPRQYAHDVLQAVAARQLLHEGINISAGQTVKYIITDALNKNPNRRLVVAELSKPGTLYDIDKYLELLLSSAANILAPFGYTVSHLRELAVYREKQVPLYAST